MAAARFGLVQLRQEYGWRPIAMDLRFPNGLIVEFYAVPYEMDERRVKGPNHDVYEKVWKERNCFFRTLEEPMSKPGEPACT